MRRFFLLLLLPLCMYGGNGAKSNTESMNGWSDCMQKIKYPQKAIDNHIEEVVKIRFQILPDGTVGKIVFKKCIHAMFKRPIIKALRGCIFNPVKDKSGKPKSVWSDQSVRFSLNPKLYPPSNSLSPFGYIPNLILNDGK
ncbi:MAG TPA: energy transducer TonB [Candidatus Kapabacteria bacterium]|nr:energy transducer TonB [Candidatus Kapabacteria bacterium]